MLIDAAQEIESLRRRNEILTAKVDVVDIFAAALLGARASGGMAPDVIWALRREIADIEAMENSTALSVEN